MWPKILCVVVIATEVLARDELLEPLYGLEGRNKMSICVASPSGRWRRCDGALYNREWVIARAQCLSTTPKELMSIVRQSAGGSCKDIAAGNRLYSSRNVRHHVMHPWFDLALVIVTRPYNDLDELTNSTNILIKLRPHGVYKWMKYYFDAYALTRDQGHQLFRIARIMKTNHNQVWYLLTTIVLPLALFMLVFIYVTFYTGSPQEVPYKKLQYSKKVSQV